jgi:hypothetical protein
MLRWLAFAIVLLAPKLASASSCVELVRLAEAHESAHEDDLAVRRYTEAVTLDATCQRGWLGLAALRLRHGDGREAERVATVGLEHIPTLHALLVSLARARWLQGRREDAERDLESFIERASPEEGRAALRELSGWYASEGKTPAQLGVWRRLLTLAADEASQKEARTMIRALVVLVSPADPVTAPPYASPVRRAAAEAAKKL